MRSVVLALLVTVTATASPAAAFVWPSTPGEVARALEGADVAERRLAAEKLAGLPAALAAPLVEKALGDADLDVRLRAARSAAELRLASASDAVVPWLSEPEARVRLAACEVVKSAPTQRAIVALGRVLGDPDATVRLAAAAAMGASEMREAVGPLLGHLDDPSTAVRAEVAAALARAGDRSAVVPLIGKVGDPAPEVRKAVARALGELGDKRATSALVLSLRDGSPDVRMETLAALGRLGAEEAALSIAPMLEERSLPDLRRAALVALGRIGSDQAIAALVGALASDDAALPTSPVREALEEAGARAQPALRAVLSGQPSPASAAGAALVLGATKAEGAARLLIDAMHRGVLAPQAGLRALAALGDPAGVPTVLELLGDPSHFVRRQAIAAIAGLLDPARPDGRAVEPIASALRDPRAPVEEREALARALGRTGSPRALDALAPLVKVKTLPLRLAALEALGALGPAGQDAQLLDALGDENASVRLRAAVALAASANEVTVRVLLDRLAVAAEEDRGAIGIALSGAMSRAKAADTAKRAQELLASSGEAVKDALVEGLGRMAGAASGEVLSALAKSGGIDDRRKVAEALAGHPEQAAALLALLADPDATVRAQAAWSAGDVAEAGHGLAGRASDPDGDVAANALASFARLAAAGRAGGQAGDVLCGALGDSRPYVRVNGLAGLAIVAQRCASGARERELLLRDPSADVRGAAARLLARVPSAEARDDARALSRCATSDRSGAVASACRKPGAPVSGAAPIVVFVVPDGRTSPVPRTPYALLRADGLIRGGTADRRGALFERGAPDGNVSLVVPGALAR